MKKARCTHMCTHSYTATCKIQFYTQMGHATSLSHTRTHTTTVRECASRTSHPPRQARDSRRVGILNWGKPSCGTPKHLSSWLPAFQEKVDMLSQRR